MDAVRQWSNGYDNASDINVDWKCSFCIDLCWNSRFAPTAVLCLKENSSACLSTIEIDQLRKSRTNPLTNQSEVSSEQIEIEKKSLAQLFINWSFFERHYENKVGLFSQIDHSKSSIWRFLSIRRKCRLAHVFRAN